MKNNKFNISIVKPTFVPVHLVEDRYDFKLMESLVSYHPVGLISQTESHIVAGHFFDNADKKYVTVFIGCNGELSYGRYSENDIVENTEVMTDNEHISLTDRNKLNSLLASFNNTNFPGEINVS